MSKTKTTGRDITTGHLGKIRTSKGREAILVERVARSGAVTLTGMTAGKLVGTIANKRVVVIAGKKKKLSARIPEELILQAKETSGIVKDADLIKAGLTALAAPNAFGVWLIANEGTLPEDFELDV